MLWGALLLNPDAFADDMLLLQALAHESGHTLLFGFTTDEPLVVNDADELHVSPLREDPRPMDGIFHATYVSARMHWTMATALESGTLSQQEKASAKSACEENLRSFFEGHETVMRHGRLSAMGKEILAAAHDYMTAARLKSGARSHSGIPAQ
jgi:HEXXH motif-containing protein